MYEQYGEEFTDCVMYSPPWKLRDAYVERMEK
jgi:hypothetical protein